MDNFIGPQFQVEPAGIAQQLLAQVESAIMSLLSGAEEISITNRRYRKTDLDKLRNMRQNLLQEVFFENMQFGGATTTRAYAAWPLRKGGIPPWTSIGPSTNL